MTMGDDVSDFVEVEDDVVDVATTHCNLAILMRNGRVGVRRIDESGNAIEYVDVGESEDKILVATSREVFVVLTRAKSSEVVKVLDDVQGILKRLVRIQFPWPVRIVQASSGHDFVVYRDANGNLFSMGTGTRGELGVGLIRRVDEPVHVEHLAGIRISKIACGGWHTVALTEGGDVYTWGWNRHGQLGKVKMSTEVYPVLVDLQEELQCSQEEASDVSATENTTSIVIKPTFCADKPKTIEQTFSLGSDSVPINDFVLATATDNQAN